MFQHGYPETVPTKVPRGRTHKSTQGGYPQKFSEGVPTKVPRKVPRIYPGHGAHKPTQRGAHKVPTRGFKSGTQEKLKNVPRIDPGHGAHESTQELTQRCTQKRYPQKHPQKEPTKRPHVVSGRRLSRAAHGRYRESPAKVSSEFPRKFPEVAQEPPRRCPHTGRGPAFRGFTQRKFAQALAQALFQAGLHRGEGFSLSRTTRAGNRALPHLSAGTFGPPSGAALPYRPPP